MTDFEDRPNITSVGAQKAIGAAIRAATSLEVRVVVVVVDAAGNTVAMVRMDGAPLFSVPVATKKAWTSAAAGARSADVAVQFNADPVLLHALAPKVDELMAVGGATPFMSGGRVAGAIGVSGATEAEDQQIADSVVESMAS